MLSDQKYLELLDAAEPALEQFEKACDAVSEGFKNSPVIQAIQQQLIDMGVLDVKVSRDGETWNSVPKEERAASIARVLGAYIDGKVTPMDKLND